MKFKTYDKLINQHILSGVILIEDRYKHIYNQGPYVVPSVVSVYNVTIDANAEKTIIKRAELAHEAKRSDRSLYDAVDTVCVKFIMSVVNETWYKELEDADTFYTNVTVQQLLKHLKDHCTGLHAVDSVNI